MGEIELWGSDGGEGEVIDVEAVEVDVEGE